MARRRNKGDERRIAQSRVGLLIDAAGQAEPDLADRYAILARRVAMRYQVRHPKLKAVCKKCGGYRAGTQGRTRIQAGRVTTTCLRCGHINRRPLKEKE